MKKHLLRMALCLPFVVAALTGAALAVDEPVKVTPGNGASITYDGTAKSFAVTLSQDVKPEAQYAILMVKDPSGEIKPENILYIDQAESTAGATPQVSFSVKPANITSGTFILGGEFTSGNSPKTLGKVEVSGVTVTGNVKFQLSTDATADTYPTVEILDSTGSSVDSVKTAANGDYSFDSIPEGKGYTVVVTKPSYCSYTLKNVAVAGKTTIKVINIEELAGDIDKNSLINGKDLRTLLDFFNEDKSQGGELSNPDADLNKDKRINGRDLQYMLDSFNNGPITEDLATSN